MAQSTVTELIQEKRQWASQSAKKKGKEALGYWVFVSHKKKRWSRCVGDKREAEKFARDLEGQIAREQFQLPGSSLRLSEYFMQWLVSQRAHCKPSTIEKYEYAWRWIEPSLGHIPLPELKRPAIRDFVQALQAAGKQMSTIETYVVPLVACLNQAVLDELIANNPASRILPRHRGEKLKTAKVLAREQLDHLLTVCRQYFPERYVMVLLFARTGLRIGETIALEWGDVLFDRHLLHVQRTWERGRIQTTKSSRRRLVDMSQQLERELSKRKETAVGRLVFPSHAGTVIQPGNFRRRDWARLFIKAGLPQIRVHDLRHTYATLLIQQGESLAYVQQQLGHSSIKITVDVYGHLTPGMNRAAVNRLDTVS